MRDEAGQVDYVLDAADAPLAFARPRWVPDAEMDITPMIDITFLLLIFFLVATRMSTDTVVELPKARYGTAVPTKESAVLTVTGDGGEGALIYKGDGVAAETRLVASDLMDQENEIAAYVQQALGEGKQYVLIKAQRNLKHREVARVARAVSQAADAQLYVAVLEER